MSVWEAAITAVRSRGGSGISGTRWSMASRSMATARAGRGMRSVASAVRIGATTAAPPLAEETARTGKWGGANSMPEGSPGPEDAGKSDKGRATPDIEGFNLASPSDASDDGTNGLRASTPGKTLCGNLGKARITGSMTRTSRNIVSEANGALFSEIAATSGARRVVSSDGAGVRGRTMAGAVSGDRYSDGIC
ncbi:hypothetical protein CCAX7_63210 [Capsulimonas corticalis]|uniref:Uncharacterized protein n=1 Tax=Capsulimonas corticalis TaxID=2219043 RepID=A0A402CWT0_9BACT|nr:hypothetical protein CCAX7_63210 [Capsulimonas corticalis]